MIVQRCIEGVLGFLAEPAVFLAANLFWNWDTI